MGRIVYGMMASLDGYIAGAGGDIGLPVPEAELHRYFNEVMKRTAVSLYGRRMYEIMKVWETWGSAPGVSEVEMDFSRAWREVPKVVVSTTLSDVGPNARLIGQDVRAAVERLREDTDGEIAVAGAALAGSLSQWGLVDEYRLFLMPVVLGGGTPFFPTGTALHLEPAGREDLPQGVTLLRYRPA